MSRLIVLLFMILLVDSVMAQSSNDSLLPPALPDSASLKDSATQASGQPKPDSASLLPVFTADAANLSEIHLYSYNPFHWQLEAPVVSRRPLPAAKDKLRGEGLVRQAVGKDLLFYLVVFLLVILGVLRRAFPKYFADLFRLFFRSTLKKKQIREQLVQTPLPSLLLNGFFVLSFGLYLAFLFIHFSINPLGNFWLLTLYCCIGLSVAYFVKFAGLKICGWLFSMEETADAYIFIVFIINKMIGILLIPFLLVLAFSHEPVYGTGLTISWILLAGLLFYRVILSYASVRNQVRVNIFHFLLYLCAFEVAPLLLVYKALMIFLNQTA